METDTHVSSNKRSHSPEDSNNSKKRKTTVDSDEVESLKSGSGNPSRARSHLLAKVNKSGPGEIVVVKAEAGSTFDRTINNINSVINDISSVRSTSSHPAHSGDDTIVISENKDEGQPGSSTLLTQKASAPPTSSEDNESVRSTSSHPAPPGDEKMTDLERKMKREMKRNIDKMKVEFEEKTAAMSRDFATKVTEMNKALTEIGSMVKYLADNVTGSQPAGDAIRVRKTLDSLRFFFMESCAIVIPLTNEEMQATLAVPDSHPLERMFYEVDAKKFQAVISGRREKVYDVKEGRYKDELHAQYVTKESKQVHLDVLLASKADPDFRDFQLYLPYFQILFDATYDLIASIENHLQTISVLASFIAGSNHNRNRFSWVERYKRILEPGLLQSKYKTPAVEHLRISPQTSDASEKLLHIAEPVQESRTEPKAVPTKKDWLLAINLSNWVDAFFGGWIAKKATPSNYEVVLITAPEIRTTLTGLNRALKYDTSLAGDTESIKKIENDVQDCLKELGDLQTELITGLRVVRRWLQIVSQRPLFNLVMRRGKGDAVAVLLNKIAHQGQEMSDSVLESIDKLARHNKVEMTTMKAYSEGDGKGLTLKKSYLEEHEMKRYQKYLMDSVCSLYDIEPPEGVERTIEVEKVFGYCNYFRLAIDKKDDSKPPSPEGHRNQ